MKRTGVAARNVGTETIRDIVLAGVTDERTIDERVPVTSRLCAT